MIDIRIAQPVGIDASAPTEEELNGGALPHTRFLIAGGHQLPFAAQEGQPPLVIPTLNVRWELTKEHTLAFVELAMKAAELLPDPTPDSDLVVATNPAQVEQAAKAFEQFKGE